MVYRVKTINDQMVVLESADGLDQVLSTKGNLYLFYTNVFNAEEGGLHSKGEDRFQEEDSPDKYGPRIEKDTH